MLIKKYVDAVVVQADYMSGDRNALASALALDPKLGILILAAEGHTTTAVEMQTFYNKPNRVEVCAVKKGTRTAEDAVKHAYSEVKAWTDQLIKWIKAGRHGPKPALPPVIAAYIGPGVNTRAATYGTQVIADEFASDATEAQGKIRTYWRLDHLPANKTTVDRQTQVGNWLTSKGFRNDRAYVFLFAKEGDRRAEKAHHFTSILTWRILQERIERDCPGIVPVAAGDDIGLRTTPTMVKFWEQDEWKKIFAGIQIDSRSAQLGMWCFIAEKFQSASIVGMRSGMIEVPALLGIRTLYLEELHNQQAERMMKWVGKVPGYSRQVVSVTPGIKQQAYWNGQSKTSQSKDVRDHAHNKGKHLEKVVLGHNVTSAQDTTRKKWPDPLLSPEKAEQNAKNATPIDLVRAVFGTGGLGQAKKVSASQFMLDTGESNGAYDPDKDEFKAILDWVKKAKKPPSAPAYSSLPADYMERSTKFAVLDKTKQDLSAVRHEKTWTEYFGSNKYLATIGIKK